MKSIIFLFLFFGLMAIGLGYYRSNQQCPPPVIEFRYLPKTFDEEQDNQPPILAIYGKMFDDISPWEKTQGYADGYPGVKNDDRGLNPLEREFKLRKINEDNIDRVV